MIMENENKIMARMIEQQEHLGAYRICGVLKGNLPPKTNVYTFLVCGACLMAGAVAVIEEKLQYDEFSDVAHEILTDAIAANNEQEKES